MTRNLTWLHISDLHARVRDDWDSRQITETLVRDLKTMQTDHDLRPDFVFFTGDLVYGAVNGETMDDQYQLARNFFDAVRTAFDPEIPLRDLYLVPGNHDVNRDEITPDQTAWLRHPDRELPEIFNAMRDGKKQWRTWVDRLANYRDFLKSYCLLHLSPDDPHLIWAEAREIAGIRVGIAGLNSAWSCANNEDKAKLWFGADWQIAQAKQRMGSVDFAFALLHHPSNWFTSHEDPVAMRHLRQEFAIVLHGHEHQEWVDSDGESRLLLSAGACYESSWMDNGYSFGSIDIDQGRGGIWLRQWDSAGRGWVPRNIARKTKDGCWPLRQLSWIGGPKGRPAKLESSIRDISPSDTVSESPLPEREILPEPGAVLVGWRVPNFRNAVFTGRENVLKTLANALLYDPQNTGTTAKPQVITCMTGIGKTNLAVEFCYRYGRFFKGVHWINAQQEIDGEIAACGAEMTLPFWPKTTTEQLRLTLLAWQNDGPRLLVLDGVEDPELLQNWLPKLSGFRLLLTTRHHDWPPHLGVQTYPLGLLSLPESLALLRKLAPRLKKAPDADLEKIAVKLGNLPLAIDLAGRYLDEIRILTPQLFLQELAAAGGALNYLSLLDQEEGDSPIYHKENLQSTFLLIWQRLNERKPIDALARQIFLACGYCAPNIPIPDKIIYKIAEGKERIADRAITRLYNLGLLTTGTAIHHLLAEFARDQDGQKQSLKILADVLRILSYEANTTGLPIKFFPLRPHVEVTARVTESANMKSVADDLWGNLGTHYRIVAEFEKAEDADRQALTIDEEIFGSDNPMMALRLNNLGRVLHVEGRLDEAKQHYERALAIDEKYLGSNHPTVALRLNNLGMILKDLGDLKGAKEKIEQALTIDEHVFGHNHPNLARDINNLGLILKDMYELPSALDAFKHARDIDEAAFGQNHPYVARDINNIGWILKDNGQFEEALKAFNRARAIDEAAFDPPHPYIASDLNNIGWTLRELKSYEEALELFNQAHTIDVEAYGPIHPTVARDLSNIGCILKDLRKFQEAQDTYESALGIYENVYGPDHPEVATVNNHIGELLKSNNKLEEAKQHFKRALEIDEKVFGPDHLAFARDTYNLGIVLKDLGDVEGAKLVIKRALAIFKNYLPYDHPLVIATSNDFEILDNQANPNFTHPG